MERKATASEAARDVELRKRRVRGGDDVRRGGGWLRDTEAKTKQESKDVKKQRVFRYLSAENDHSSFPFFPQPPSVRSWFLSVPRGPKVLHPATPASGLPADFLSSSRPLGDRDRQNKK